MLTEKKKKTQPRLPLPCLFALPLARPVPARRERAPCRPVEGVRQGLHLCESFGRSFFSKLVSEFFRPLATTLLHKEDKKKAQPPPLLSSLLCLNRQELATCLLVTPGWALNAKRSGDKWRETRESEVECFAHFPRSRRREKESRLPSAARDPLFLSLFALPFLLLRSPFSSPSLSPSLSQPRPPSPPSPSPLSPNNNNRPGSTAATPSSAPSATSSSSWTSTPAQARGSPSPRRTRGSRGPPGWTAPATASSTPRGRRGRACTRRR